MPIIQETDEEHLVWEQQQQQQPVVGASATIPGSVSGPGILDPNVSSSDMDVALANVCGGDFFSSLPALDRDQAADATVLNDSGVAADAFMLGQPGWPDSTLGLTGVDWWCIPKVPCAQCASGNFFCKQIKECGWMGRCTSCVALGWDCSFVVPAGSNSILSMPSSSWEIPTDDIAATLDPSFEPSFAVDEADMDFIRSLTAPTLAPAVVEQDVAALDAPTNTVTEPASLPEKEAFGEEKPATAAKAGARFSRESVKILKGWLTAHSRHPYPNDHEKDVLMRQTGLSKQQIGNWLANARRRGKVQPPRSTSPIYKSSGMDIPARRGTPALESMNPLQRWANSPPESEPANVTDIARAVTASAMQDGAGYNSPYLSSSYADDGSGRSLFNGSSASSAGTSRSSGSSFSAYSHASRGSFRSALSQISHGSREQKRRRRKTVRRRPDHGTGLSVPVRTFQCTFCTETFRTKFDWQRHEKSIHLSLERWACAFEGPYARKPETGALACVFCGQENPDDAHIESHNFSTCMEKTIHERVFFRKDHLHQHLRLVHNVKYLDWAMQGWQMSTPDIRSRCGFCSKALDSWGARVDHLAEHFKAGKTMADWKGEWGFEPPILKMVEKSIPPYRIDEERQSPYPYVGGQSPPESPRSAWDLIKLEMDYFRSNHLEQHGTLPTDEEMQVEACRIIFASEVLSIRGIASELSWLRDLFMSNVRLVQQARFGPLRSAAENRLSILKINGKDNLFEKCMLEHQLIEFVRGKSSLGLTAMDHELQDEACKIVGRIEEMSTSPSESIANWMIRLILGSTVWLAGFRQRAHLPRTEDLGDEFQRSSDPSTIDSTIHSYSRLEAALAEHLAAQRHQGVEPSDEDLQRQARIIIYEYDDGWNQTAADNVEWLAGFRARHLGPSSQSSPQSSSKSKSSPAAGTEVSKATASSSLFCYNSGGSCDRILKQDLRRWVAATMSPNNPTRHIPTDEELQHQARWIIYNEDDPWNQTPADNQEWLLQFKMDAGIIKASAEKSLSPEALPGQAMEDVVAMLGKDGTGNADLVGLDLMDERENFESIFDDDMDMNVFGPLELEPTELPNM